MRKTKMRMPGKTLFLLTALLMLVLSACAGTAPYLDGEGRTEIEDSLFASLHIVETNPADGSLTAEFRNTTQYDLADVYFRIPDDDYVSTDDALAHTPRMNRNELVSITTRMPSRTLKAGDGVRLYLEYTIGAFTYFSEERSITIGEGDIADLKIFVETDNGRIPLEASRTTSFDTGKEVRGLKTAAIYSLKPEAKLNTNGYLLTIEVTGKEPEGGYSSQLGYKLINADGVICESDVLYLLEGKTSTCYFFSLYAIPPGEYELRFEEYSR